MSFAYNCEEDLPSGETNYMTFASSSVSTTVAIGSGSGSMDVVVYTGNKTGSDRALGLIVDTDNSTLDPSAYSLPASVTIPGGTNKGTFTVQFNESGLDLEFSTVVVGFAPNQGIDTAVDTDSVTISAGLVCPTASEVTIAIATDSYPEETSWILTDGSGATVSSGGPYADANTTITTDVISLSAGTYLMTLFDSYGDGGSSFSVQNGCTQEYASGAAPDAGGGYPVETSVSGSFTID